MFEKMQQNHFLRITLAVLLTLVMILSLGACGEKDVQSKKKKKKIKSKQSSVVSEKEDSSSDTDNDNSDSKTDVIEEVDDEGNTQYTYVYRRKDGTVSPLATVGFKGLTAENSRLMSNPDRGFRNECFIDVAEIAASGPDKEKMVDHVVAFLNEIKQTMIVAFGEDITIDLPYLYLDYWKYTGIDDECIAALDAIFEAHRQMKMKMIPNLVFQRELTQLANGGEYGIGASQEIILDTIEKLGQVIYDNRDVIFMFPLTSMQGAFGEGGHGGNENPRLNKPELYNAIATQLVPEDIYICSRMPEYKNEIEKALPVYDRIGFNNHAFYGMLNFASGGSGDFDPGNWRWEQAKSESAYTPNDVEFYVWEGYLKQYIEQGFYPDGLNVMRALSELHISTLNCAHGYVDAMYYYGEKYGDTLFGKWASQEITENILDQYGFTYSKSWFRDKKGNVVKRNALDYIRDHLGYRLEAKSLKVTGGDSAGEKIHVNLSLVNVGFGAAYNLKSGFAIIDAGNNEVCSVEAGDPTTWHPTSPTNYDDRSLLNHSVTADLTLPDKEGTYRLVFFIKNSMGQYARLANEIPFEAGYNVLYQFEM